MVLNELEDLSNIISDTPSDLVLLGDFNIDYT